MRDRLPFRLGLALLLAGLIAAWSLGASQAAPALQTVEPTVFDRPVLTLIGYSTNKEVTPGGKFTLSFRVANEGGSKARNIVFTFVPGDFQPSGSGGVVAGGVIAPDADTGYSQGLVASNELALKSYGSLQISASYTDDLGTSYSETFNLTLQVTKKSSSSSARPTSTPTPAPRPILLIDGYQVDVDPLKPGSIFNMEIRVANVGGSEARSVTLVIGGGTLTTDPSGTPGAATGGVSATGGLENFAPLGESNVAYLGNLASGAQLTSIHALIVNSTTLPGAYPLKISLIYADSGSRTYTDDQSITLLVYAPPMLEIGFYQPPDPLFVGQPGTLPIQVLNLDRKAVVLSRVRVESEAAEITNGELPIGYLDTGLAFTIDALAMPFEPGPLSVVVAVDYVDDFNEAQVIQQTLNLEVIEAEPIPEFEGGGGGGGGVDFGPEVTEPETFWDKALRFLRGLLGLDSAPPESAPLEGPPSEEPIQVIPGAPGTKG
jgi:hypothetical protein